VTLTTPRRGAVYNSFTILATIHLRTNFELSSFIRSRERRMVTNLKCASRHILPTPP